MYQAIIEDGYIISIAAGVARGNIAEAEYRAIREAIESAPTAPDGYYYRLRKDLEWELFQLPEMPEIPEAATEADYIAALGEMGVSL